MIGRLAEVAGGDALVLVVSPGWRGQAGVVLGAGAGARTPSDLHDELHDEFLGADLLDLAPTVAWNFWFAGGRSAGPGDRGGGSEISAQAAASPPLPEPIKPDDELLRIAAADGFAPPPPPPAAWRAQGLAELGFMLLRRSPEAAANVTRRCSQARPGQRHGPADPRHPRCSLWDARTNCSKWRRHWSARRRTADGAALARGAQHILRQEPGLAQPWLTKAESDPDTETLLTVAAAWLIAKRLGEGRACFQGCAQNGPRPMCRRKSALPSPR